MAPSAAVVSFNGQVAPASAEAECALLGSLLVNNSTYREVADFLRPEHFFLQLHGRLFEASAALIERNQVASPITLRPFFERERELSDAGGPSYFAKLATAARHVDEVADLGRHIVDLAKRRQIVEVCTSLVSRAAAPNVTEDADALLQAAEAELFQLSQRPDDDAKAGPVSAKEAAGEALAHLESRYRGDPETLGLRTGIGAIDEVLGAMDPASLTVLAGRPSMGKTSLALGVAAHNAGRFLREHREAAEGDPAPRSRVVSFHSLEMSASHLGGIMLGQLAGVPPHGIETGHGTHDDMARLLDAERRLPDLPLIIDDRARQTLTMIRAQLRRLQRRYEIGLIVIDHLHIMAPDAMRRDGNRTVEIGEMSAGCKALAKQFAAPVLLLSQLSRANEMRDDKRPTLADLRFAGEIEQDADVVAFVHRDEYYLRRDQPRPDAKPADVDRWEAQLREAAGKAAIIIAKQRRGPRDAVTIGFDAPLQRFHDLRR